MAFAKQGNDFLQGRAALTELENRGVHALQVAVDSSGGWQTQDDQEHESEGCSNAI